MEKNFFERVKNYALSGVIGVSLYFGSGCEPTYQQPVYQPKTNLDDRVVREVPLCDDYRIVVIDTDGNLNTARDHELQLVSPNNNGINPLDSAKGLVEMLGNRAKRGTRTGVSVIIDSDGNGEFDYEFRMGNGGYIVGYTIYENPNASLITSEDSIIRVIKEASCYTPSDDGNNNDNNSNDNNGNDGNGLPNGITRYDFNDVFGEGGLVPLNQPYTSVTETAMENMLSDAGVSEGTSSLIEYLVDNNHLRNGGPYDSTNGPQGDFVFDQAKNKGYYLITRANETGLELLVLGLSNTDAQRISNFVGAGRVTE